MIALGDSLGLYCPQGIVHELIRGSRIGYLRRGDEVGVSPSRLVRACPVCGTKWVTDSGGNFDHLLLEAETFVRLAPDPESLGQHPVRSAGAFDDKVVLDWINDPIERRGQSRPADVEAYRGAYMLLHQCLLSLAMLWQRQAEEMDQQGRLDEALVLAYAAATVDKVIDLNDQVEPSVANYPSVANNLIVMAKQQANPQILPV